MSKNSILSDAIKENIRIVDYARQIGFTPKKIGRQYTLEEHDSVRIDVDNNVFYRHSVGRGGSIIDFVMEFEEVSMPEAIRKLRACLSPDYKLDTILPPMPVVLVERKPFELPKPVDGRYSRVYSYLTKVRGINGEIVKDMFNRKQLYEDKDHHNCVFVGYDQSGRAAFANVRGTISDMKYRGDIESSSKAVGFFVGNGASHLFVSEAPIDSMSIMTLLKYLNVDYKSYDYLAISGTCYESLPYTLSRVPDGQYKSIFLAVDNDTAGAKARLGYRYQLEAMGYNGRIIDKIPKGKDWNDDLKCFLGSHPQRNISQGQQQTKINQSKERGLSYEQGA